MTIGLPVWARKTTHMSDANMAGVTVTGSSTAHTKGSYTEILADSGPRSCGITVEFNGLSTSNTVTACLVDIAIGAASSEVIVLPDLDAWGAPLSEPGYNRRYFFPLVIPANSRISARCQTSISSDTVVVSVIIHQYPPAEASCGEIIAYGVDSANSCGTSVPQGTQPTWGTWTQITSSTSRPHNVFAVATDPMTDPTSADQHTYVQLGVGSSPAAEFAMFVAKSDGSELISSCYPEILCSTIIPAGSAIYARMKTNANAENRGVIVYAGFVNSLG